MYFLFEVTDRQKQSQPTEKLKGYPHHTQNKTIANNVITEERARFQYKKRKVYNDRSHFNDICFFTFCTKRNWRRNCARRRSVYRGRYMWITLNLTWHYNFVLIFVECLLKLVIRRKSVHRGRCMCITVNLTWHYNFVLIFVECLLKLVMLLVIREFS